MTRLSAYQSLINVAASARRIDSYAFLMDSITEITPPLNLFSPCPLTYITDRQPIIHALIAAKLDLANVFSAVTENVA